MEIGDQMEDNFLNDRMIILKEIEHLRKEMNEVGFSHIKISLTAITCS